MVVTEIKLSLLVYCLLRTQEGAADGIAYGGNGVGVYVVQPWFEKEAGGSRCYCVG